MLQPAMPVRLPEVVAAIILKMMVKIVAEFVPIALQEAAPTDQQRILPRAVALIAMIVLVEAVRQ